MAPKRKPRKKAKAKKPARTRRTPKKAAPDDWGAAFLRALAATGNVSASAEAAGVGRRTAYDRRGADPAFAALWADAIEEGTDALELEARRRAHDGLRRVKFHQGAPVMVPLAGPDGQPVKDGEGEPVLVPYVEHEYSDTLMIFLLKAHRPEKYRERHEMRHTGEVRVIFDDDWFSPPGADDPPPAADAAPAAGPG